MTVSAAPPAVGGGKGKENEPLPLTRFVLYETKTRFYIFASNQSSLHSNRVLKIDRTSDELVVIEDSVVYSNKQLAELKKMIELGNKSAGGFVEVMTFYGIAGFVRFTQGWYMILITKREALAIIGGHYVYHCDETVMKPIAKIPPERTAEEIRQLSTFQKIDLGKHFYFSYTYDLTSTLQSNLTGVRTSSSSSTNEDYRSSFRINTRYMWNYRLLKDAFPEIDEEGRSWKGNLGGSLKGGGAGGTGGWVLPLVHGFVDQAKLDILGRAVYITLIGRRSRLFAGARYLKRGANDMGHVANEVETEQIVSEPLTTPFHTSAPRSPHDGAASHPDDDPEHQLHQQRLKFPNPRFTSYVQYRGSIPLLWSQDASASNFKPPIEINNVDPYFSAAAQHFDYLLEKYGGPVIVLNLVKSVESTPRESKLLHEYSQCVAYLNQFLPKDHQIIYIPFDMSKANKAKHQDTMKIMDEIAEEATAETGFFHTGRMIRDDGSVPYRDRLSLQHGVARTNCVDCLDRTNIAQFSLGKKALGNQLYALGIIPEPDISYYSDANFLFTEMYHDHGDTLALQYSGGALVNRLDTYQKNLQWSSHSRDMIENIKRYYANSMLDAEKQVATDLFLGVTKESRSLELSRMTRRSYDDWFDPAHLEEIVDLDTAEKRMKWVISQACDFWEDYYRPRLCTHFERHYAAKVNSSLKFLR
ncbi:SacI homology domain-containing protein [Mrakia frigida]|uniref:phosphatidylinositol-3,5-bisphosphate 5-phosphatase n=1 Tax=Mrakia frigida TaxID=29902 RepID=UPI003FCC1E75